MQDPDQEYTQIATFYQEMEKVLAQSDQILTEPVPSVSGWSIAGHTYHISRANAATWRGLERILKQESPAVEHGEENRLGKLLFRADRMKRGAIKAPDFVAPSSELTLDEVRLWAERSRLSFESMKDVAPSLPVDSYRIEHVLLGPLNARQWLTFIRIHSFHHLAIIHDILGAHQAAH